MFRPFDGTVSGPRHLDLFRAICSDPSLQGLPEYVKLSGNKIPVSADWRARCLAHAAECAVFWKDGSYETIAGFSYRPGVELVHFTLPIVGDGDQHRAALERLPFELADLDSPHQDSWGKSQDKRSWGFSRGYAAHGWACAFRGAGHDRLVSRRWLDFGPWRVLRRPDDTTFIQFHDLAITDPEEAFAQAAPGHQRMGIDPIGGFIQGIDPDVIEEVKGVYIADTRTLEIPIAPAIEVTQQEMRVACALRLYQRLHPPATERIERIAYVFIERRDAEAHLHELWLRELECWYLDENGRHRIDADYHPTPSPPAWVKRLAAR